MTIDKTVSEETWNLVDALPAECLPVDEFVPDQFYNALSEANVACNKVMNYLAKERNFTAYTIKGKNGDEVYFYFKRQMNLFQAPTNTLETRIQALFKALYRGHRCNACDKFLEDVALLVDVDGHGPLYNLPGGDDLRGYKELGEAIEQLPVANEFQIVNGMLGSKFQGVNQATNERYRHFHIVPVTKEANGI